MTNIEGLYVGGDCGGETQGILQATMMGIKIAESVQKELFANKRNILTSHLYVHIFMCCVKIRYYLVGCK